MMLRCMHRVVPALALVVLAACPSTPDPPPELGWHVALEGLPGVVLGIWGPSADDIFAVGGTIADGGGEELILWHDGTSWWRMDIDAPTLWWVFGFAHDNVWAVGAQGAAFHFDGQTWNRVETGVTQTLWGVWGQAPDDLWTVGGSALSDDPAVLLHWNGTAFSPAAGVDTAGQRFFKVWGSAADDVHVVGDHGTILHFDGASWSAVESPTKERLVTVVGRARDDVYAVGGLSSPVLLHRDAMGWEQIATPDIDPGLMGVWTAPGQHLVVTGFYGLVAVGDTDALRVQKSATELCLHATWSDRNGLYLAGGGNLFVPTPPAGTILSVGQVAAGPVKPWP